jgi:hypothetical protein
MVVHQPNRLHERVTDGRSDELEAATKEITAHQVGLRSTRGDFTERTAPVYAWLVPDKRPDVRVKAAELTLNDAEGLCIPDGADKLETVANDAGVLKKTLDFRRRETSHPGRIEARECFAIRFPLLENRLPTQPGLRTFQRQELEKNPVVVNWHTPLGIVIRDAEWSASPVTTGE